MFHQLAMSILRKVTDKLGMTSSFNPKPAPLRTDASLSSLDYNALETARGRHDRPTFSLGGHRLSFREGQWVVERDGRGRSTKAKCRDCLERLRRRNRRLKEQVNLLKLQVDVLMDMVADMMRVAARPSGLSLERSGPSGVAPFRASAEEKL